jgi:hypothetical protein
MPTGSPRDLKNGQMNLWLADFPPAQWPASSALSLATFWKQGQRWQGHDWQVSLWLK